VVACLSTDSPQGDCQQVGSKQCWFMSLITQHVTCSRNASPVCGTYMVHMVPFILNVSIICEKADWQQINKYITSISQACYLKLPKYCSKLRNLYGWFKAAHIMSRSVFLSTFYTSWGHTKFNKHFLTTHWYRSRFLPLCIKHLLITGRDYGNCGQI
jgi:hypothetical protein